MPLSGGDRKSLTKNLRDARQAYDAEMRKAAEAQRIADLKLAEARLARRHNPRHRSKTRARREETKPARSKEELAHRRAEQVD